MGQYFFGHAVASREDIVHRLNIRSKSRMWIYFQPSAHAETYVGPDLDYKMKDKKITFRIIVC